jgi:hypothetical protein
MIISCKKNITKLKLMYLEGNIDRLVPRLGYWVSEAAPNFIGARSIVNDDALGGKIAAIANTYWDTLKEIKYT